MLFRPGMDLRSSADIVNCGFRSCRTGVVLYSPASCGPRACKPCFLGPRPVKRDTLQSLRAKDSEKPLVSEGAPKPRRSTVTKKKPRSQLAADILNVGFEILRGQVRTDTLHFVPEELRGRDRSHCKDFLRYPPQRN